MVNEDVPANEDNISDFDVNDNLIAIVNEDLNTHVDCYACTIFQIEHYEGSNSTSPIMLEVTIQEHLTLNK